uniref:Reverse transcriptase zinc-binding domain-containing protein n=1 Tax=Aegilops tauschii subsp. strangulata TaxID=200361 RepID=A0A453PEG3_AEGTS
LDRWKQLLDTVQQCTLTADSDMPIWSLETNGIYSVKSFYQHINFGEIASAIRDDLWKILCPQKIHVFLWLCAHNKILTRDNLAKRRDVEDPSCLFCTELETVQHLLFECVVAQHVWNFVSDFFGIDRIVNF